ncbi:hypothetical protein [Segetibacter aerophilus]|uniref:Uncharacterized protein n=1 Tax=Segetibacter aerophilus TaxID=670293 RepID=A0A512BCA4_9BACT|nr:hypothetical protein [Segetibacter aerophilus]GEO09603.1 hypothetical protein SAE01_20990 [Segetibacter aerophilus]
MNDKEQDPNLQAPQEANTTKHINFLETEEGDENSTSNTKGNDNNDDSPTKKAWEELRNSNKNDQKG